MSVHNVKGASLSGGRCRRGSPSISLFIAAALAAGLPGCGEGAQPAGDAAAGRAPGSDRGRGHKRSGPAGEGAAHAALPGVASIWAVHDGEKVDRDDAGHPARKGNLAWDGSTIRLFGARNEVIAFQIIIEAGPPGVSELDVDLPGLAREGGGGEILYAPPGEDPTAYEGRPISIFTEHYMHVQEPSDAWWVYDRGQPAAPASPTGWKPVQLVPENAGQGMGGLPMDVAPGQSQAVWIEVYTARDLPAGLYRGSVTVRAGGAERNVPLELTLLDFTLPDDNSLNAMLYFEPEQVPLYLGEDLVDRFHRLAHRQRVELVHAYDPASLDAAMGRFDGSDFGSDAGYDGPGRDVGNRIAPASFYGPGPEYEQFDSAKVASDAWMTHLAAHVPGAVTFLYMPDEPVPSQYARIRELASFIHDNPGPGGALPVFVTSAYRSGLDGAIDIWCAPAQSFDVQVAEQQRAAGRAYWFYNGRRPNSGAVIIDSPATDARANAWIAFKHGAEVYFFWHANHWLHNSQKQGERQQDVWADPVTFDNRGQPGKPFKDQGFVNGDGVLLYPGKDVLHPEQDRGIRGPISTIQLANLRRGLQDHLYLTMARDLGLDGVVDGALSSIVPAVLSEAGSAVSFSERGDDYEAARRALGEAIAEAR